MNEKLSRADQEKTLVRLVGAFVVGGEIDWLTAARLVRVRAKALGLTIINEEGSALDEAKPRYVRYTLSGLS